MNNICISLNICKNIIIQQVADKKYWCILHFLNCVWSAVCFYTYSTTQLELVTFLVLNTHMWVGGVEVEGQLLFVVIFLWYFQSWDFSAIIIIRNLEQKILQCSLCWWSLIHKLLFYITKTNLIRGANRFNHSQESE